MQHITLIYFITVFNNSFLGLQPFSRGKTYSWKHTFSLFYSTVLNALILKTFLADDPFFDKFALRRYNDKPFLALLLQYNACLNYSLAHLANLIYYIYTLDKIAALIEGSGSFKKVEAFRSTRTPAFGALFLLLIFIFGYQRALTWSVDKLPSHWALLNVLIIFINYLYIFLPLGLTHYIQYGTYRTMLAIADQQFSYFSALELSFPVFPRPRPLSVSSICLQVREAARLNWQLHRLNSFPLAVLIGSHSIVAIVSLSRSESHVYYSYLFYIAGTFAYLLHIAQLSGKTRTLLRTIIAKEKGRRVVDGDYCSWKEKNSSVSGSAEITLLPKKLTIQLTELALYERYLQINLFTICNFDYVFLACWTLFIVNYSVLIVQTTTE